VKNSWNASSGVVQAFVLGAVPTSCQKGVSCFLGGWLLAEVETDSNVHFRLSSLYKKDFYILLALTELYNNHIKLTKL